MSMRFASGISDAVSVKAAVEEACQQAAGQLKGLPCQLACVFASPLYRSSWASLLERVHAGLKPQVLIGCSGSGIIGGERECEWVPAISIVAAHLPDVRMFPFVVAPDELELSVPGGFWVDKIGAAPQAQPIFVLLADPLTCDPKKLVEELNETYRSCPIVGGLVSGGNNPGEHSIFLDTEVYHDGAVGLAMTGNIAMDAIVSQGCRAVGRSYVITKGEDNVVWELGGKPALEVLHWVISTLSPEDRELAQQGSIFVGLVIDEMRSRFSSGDFLIRTIVGVDPNAGALAIGERVEVGQTLQFHLRDANTSRDELRRLLAQRGQGRPGLQPVGGLLFNCLGRGKSLYGFPNHDLKTIMTMSGRLPVGGFFCNGEIGPIGRTNFLHGYTASLGLFRPLDTSTHGQTVSDESGKT